MSMVCPQCQQVSEQQLQCGGCGCRMLFQTPDPLADSGLDRDGGSQWQHSPWGKILIGVLLAQGLSYGLEQLLTAGLRAGADVAVPNVWGTLLGLVLLHAAHGVSLLIGGAITGAGQRRGWLYGVSVGLFNGMVCLAFRPQWAEGWGALVAYSQPLLHMGAGAVGGLVGMHVWRPTPDIPFLQEPAAGASTKPVSAGWSPLAGPVHYGRVVLGVVIVVVGVVWSQAIVDLVLRASNGTLTISSQLQAQLVGWEVSALLTLVGAGLAGASTFNGLKQGLCVAAGASIAILGAHLASPKLSTDLTILPLACVLLLSLIGGWFGGQLFPPLDPVKRRRPAY